MRQIQQNISHVFSALNNIKRVKLLLTCSPRKEQKKMKGCERNTSVVWERRPLREMPASLLFLPVANKPQHVKKNKKKKHNQY